MLIRFVVRNFRSFKEETELSMIPGRSRKHPAQVVRDSQRQGYHLLKAAIMYGANASGKSNFVAAIRFARTFILTGTRSGERIKLPPFRLDQAGPQQPTRFEFEIKISGQAYAYGFEVTSTEVQTEWLYALSKTKDPKRLFERSTENRQTQVDFDSKTLSLNQEERQFLQFVARGTRPNQLFLKECDERNISHFSEITKWFRQMVVLPPPAVETNIFAWLLGENDGLRENLVRALKAFDLGISDIHFREVDPSGRASLLAKFPEFSPKGSQDDGEGKARELIMFSNSQETFMFQRDSNESEGVRLYRVMTIHQLDDKPDVYFDLNDESDGTLRLIDLLSGFMTSVEAESVFIVDELDRSLHPLLSYKFVDFFLKSTRGNPNQLIVTTHESCLLDLDLLRRDEIWFVEKNKDGVSDLYSLEEFTPRHDKDIHRGYLQGRYGAIPIIHNVANLGWR